MEEPIKVKSYELWLENENKEAFPVFISIEESVMNKWLKDNCWYNGETYWLNEKEFPLANAPYNANGYVVKYEDEIKGFVRARHMENGKMPVVDAEMYEDEGIQLGGM